ncbi:MAG: M1 family aminopeptidase [Candidatus Thorarchaeota archaeon]
MSNEYDLKCTINPKKGQIKVRGTIIIPSSIDSAFFILNRGLQWKKAVRRTASGARKITVSRTDAIEVPKFYNGNLWTFDVLDTQQEEFVIEIEYSGQIHPPAKESQMPAMGYIKRDFVELACYSAWYPVPFNMETNMSYELTIEGPADWTWEANAKLQQVESKGESALWRLKQTRPVNDISIVGLPKRDAHLDSESIFWGPRDMVGSHKVLDTSAQEMRKLLDEWLGPRSTSDSLRFAITPRELGGAYARSGLIVVGGGYSTDASLRRPVLQAMCHEICHDWFCKASVSTYDNWLDEALAEYCSIMITDDYLDEGFLEKRVEKTKDRLEKQGHVSAIRNLTRDEDEAYAAYYFRGFLLLHEISDKVGHDEFRKRVGEFAQICVKQRVVTTDMFLEFMEKKIGKKTSKIANQWLDYEGVGIPT